MSPELEHEMPPASRVQLRGRVLRPGLRVKDHVDACRGAGLSFLWCSRAWGKRELAQWLVGPYARATGPMRSAPAVEGPPREAPPVTEADVRQLLRRSRRLVIASLRTVPAWREEPGFARRMLDIGLVVGLVDDEASLGYAPVSAREMRLVDRVRSLFIADYLTRPDDWARFRICDGCEGPTFDLHNEHGVTCRAARAA